jgi:hypothetical protein
MTDGTVNSSKICILCMKWGTAFGVEYVNTLYRAVRDNLGIDHDFICITDNEDGLDPGVICRSLNFLQPDWPAWQNGRWPKLQMFDREIVGGYDAVLFLDLDLIVTGDLQPLVDVVRNQGGLFLMPKFRGFVWRTIPAEVWDRIPAAMNKVTRGNSSIVGFVPSEQFHLYEDFNGASDLVQYENDQNYISALAYDRKCYPKGWCIGIHHLIPYWPFGLIFRRYQKIPQRSRIVIFNGRPKPEELVGNDVGHWGYGRRRAFGAVGWVQHYLQKYST